MTGGGAALPYGLLAAVLAGTFALRLAGVVAGGLLREGTPVYRWIGCVAFAIAAGLMSKVIFVPTGLLAETPLLARAAAVAVGLTVLWTLGRKLLWAIGAAVIVFAVFGSGLV